MKVLRGVLIAAALLLLLVFVPSESSLADVVSIPLDAKAGPAVNDFFFLSDTEYEDPSLRVVIRTGREYDSYWWMARIRISDPSQLRTAAASTNGEGTANGITMAKRVNAVLAINGDYWSGSSWPYGMHIVRQGVTRRHNASGDLDVLAIDDMGDFHIFMAAKESDFENLPYTVVNSFTFGPALIVDGEKVAEYTSDSFRSMGGQKPTQRMCIAQVGPLEYMVVCCSGPEDANSVGLTIEQFRDLVWELGNGRVQNAYNLDGGTSSWLIFHSEKINVPNNPKRRPLADIIYFASAWEE
ncbi:MAG: phosphodiester glycosidase family protein [Clostridia bacterium]|nr:phosphodiester glycosidase family protein [Clostridia bacterium]